MKAAWNFPEWESRVWEGARVGRGRGGLAQLWPMCLPHTWQRAGRNTAGTHVTASCSDVAVVPSPSSGHTATLDVGREAQQGAWPSARRKILLQEGREGQ